jgi:hypothetical protein
MRLKKVPAKESNLAGRLPKGISRLTRHGFRQISKFFKVDRHIRLVPALSVKGGKTVVFRMKTPLRFIVIPSPS